LKKGKETKRKNKKSNRSYLKYIAAGGVLSSVIASVLTGLLDPIIEDAKYFLYPTSATVEGTVQKMDRPLPDVKARVDDKFEDMTGDGGRFYVEGIPHGLHHIGILTQENNMLYCDQFDVPRGVRNYKIEDMIKVDAVPQAQNIKATSCTSDIYKRDEKQAPYKVDLMYADGQSKTSTNRDVVVWIKSSPEVLSSVERVTYYLHNTFKPSVITRYPEDKFILLLSAWGQFSIHAKVYFSDKQVKDLDANIVFH
jgi:hypothetical protein